MVSLSIPIDHKKNMIFMMTHHYPAPTTHTSHIGKTAHTTCLVEAPIAIVDHNGIHNCL